MHGIGVCSTRFWAGGWWKFPGIHPEVPERTLAGDPHNPAETLNRAQDAPASPPEPAGAHQRAERQIYPRTSESGSGMEAPDNLQFSDMSDLLSLSLQCFSQG
jgi:hypothetical protein